MRVNATELAALRAIAAGRVPVEEVLRARLKRKGLISRGLLGDHRYFLTVAGVEVLERAA